MSHFIQDSNNDQRDSIKILKELLQLSHQQRESITHLVGEQTQTAQSNELQLSDIHSELLKQHKLARVQREELIEPSEDLLRAILSQNETCRSATADIT